MNLEHASRLASTQARRAAGDLYPDPWLLPSGQRRALDALLAVVLGPAHGGGETFRSGFERTLRGRPGGPLLLALWSAASAAELAHEDLRRLVESAARPLPDVPSDRAAFEGDLSARVTPFARCFLNVLERNREPALGPAVSFGMALVHTRLLLDSRAFAAAARFPWPESTLARSGLSREEWQRGINDSRAVAWRTEIAAWAEEHLQAAAALPQHLGARWRRALDGERRRVALLLRRLRDPRADPMRKLPRLGSWVRWRGRARAFRTLARSVLLPHAS